MAALVLGYVALTAVVAAGVAAVVAGSPGVLTALTMTGAAYLVWMGVSAIRHSATPSSGEAGVGSSWTRQVLAGASVSGLNPKALLLFLALLPQFTDPSSGWPVAAQILLLGMVHTASCAVTYSGVGVGARLVLGARPTVARAVSRFSGAAMVAIGTALAVHQLAV